MTLSRQRKTQQERRNSTEKKKQLHANPAIQNHRLNHEDEQRGKLFPGSDKSKRRDSRQQNEDRTGENKPRGFYICFAPGSPRWNYHSDKFCWSKERFAKIKNDPEAYFLEQNELMQQEPVDKRSEQTSHQYQNPKRSRTDRQGQANQGAATQSPQTSAQKQFLQGSTEHSQLQQQMQQMHSQMYREYWDPYAYHNSMQSLSVSEFINPWQLQGMQQSMQGRPSLYHFRQFKIL